MLFVKVQSLKEELEERNKQLETAEDKVSIYQLNVLLCNSFVSSLQKM